MIRRFLFFAFSILLTACGALSPLSPATQPVPVTETFSPPTPQATASPTGSPGRVLRIWLPVQFDPGAETPAAAILNERLGIFVASHPGLRLDIRLKGGDKAASLQDTLSFTHDAAPDILPDLVALQRTDLEAAALKGILHPLDGLTTLLADPDWYSYARQSGHVQNATYGLPFAGDALVLLYRPAQFESAPVAWQDLAAKHPSLAFASDDPNALFLMNLYISTGASLLDDTNHPTLNAAMLASALNQMTAFKLIPLQGDAAVLNAFRDGRTDLAVTWASRLISDPVPGSAMLPLPGLSGTPWTLASGWEWALAGSDPQNQALATELAEWLVADDFLSDWTKAAGYLPPRSTALNRWPDPTAWDAVSQSMQGMPSADILTALGPVLHDALGRVLKGEQVQAVADSAAQSLK